ncbi:homeobox-leucine zipper protein HAT22-like [Amaranthus tricolor]|uniref:homeobox-leucine zipper protein HAT22-like n=1 Tax=Amaranthus tricolor TaxID=29722 RepID=UPI00258EA7DA|nr:homeobox-leucine zipper protein HAT22-like [Amaranthus tricolor]
MVSPSEDQALTLGLGISYSTKTIMSKNNPVKQPHVMVYDHEPSLALSLSGETYQTVERKVMIDHQEPPCSVSVASSLSNVVSVKRERESASSDDLEIERGSSRISDEDEDGSGPTNTPRKKLRLTKEQSALLEESFKQQSTLNPKQKQALADRLNLRPRQVEVWFQNRRARTKLKQTEVDCEYLKKCCETLTDENRRLQKELQELKALKLGQPFYMQLPAATLTMCPSCERIGAGVNPASSTNPSTNSKTIGIKSHFNYPPQQIRPLLVD